MRQWWRRQSSRRKLGGLLSLLGVGLTVALAFLGNEDEPPAASTQALIALLAILSQFGAAGVFSGDGRADPTLAQRSVARLIRMARRASEARLAAEALQTSGLQAAQMRAGVGELSVHLSYLEEGYLESIDDWRTFHPDAVQQAEGKSLDDE